MDYKTLKKQAEIFKAISHETRLAILHILEKEDKCVNDIVAALNEKERTSVSKHLSVLKQNGIISVKEKGTKRFYHLDAQCLLSAVNCTIDMLNSKTPCSCQ